MAAQIVRTTGVNWQSVGVISGIVAAWFTLLSTFIVYFLARRDNKNTQQNLEIKDEIATAVNHLGEVLSARMETKDTVSLISQRLARVEGAMGISNGPKG